MTKAAEGLANPIVRPWLMSKGWFVGTHLPKRLRAAGLTAWRATPPLGLTPGLGRLQRDRLAAQLNVTGARAADVTMIIAAYGSPTNARPRIATEAAARALAPRLAFRSVRARHVDEPPAIRDAARVDGPAVVPPFFAARAGHVVEDPPDELDAAGYRGDVLDPVGFWLQSCTLAAAFIGEARIAEAGATAPA